MAKTEALAKVLDTPSNVSLYNTILNIDVVSKLKRNAYFSFLFFFSLLGFDMVDCRKQLMVCRDAKDGCM